MNLKLEISETSVKPLKFVCVKRSRGNKSLPYIADDRRAARGLSPRAHTTESWSPALASHNKALPRTQAAWCGRVEKTRWGAVISTSHSLRVITQCPSPQPPAPRELCLLPFLAPFQAAENLPPKELWFVHVTHSEVFNNTQR